jgi:hypothetical protein
MRRIVRAAGAAALLLLWAAPTLAAEPTMTGGCTLEVKSYDANDVAIDDATGPNKVPGSTLGSAEHPFRIAWDGRVDFHFVTPTVFQNNNWQIYAENVPVPILKGQDDNPLDKDELGFINIASTIPSFVPRFAGVVYVHGHLEAAGGQPNCDGSGYVQIMGDPSGTFLWYLMLALIAAGLLFLVATPYTHDWEEGVYTPMSSIPGQPPQRPY